MLSLMTFCTYTVQTVPFSKKPTQFVLIDQRIFHNEVFHLVSLFSCQTGLYRDITHWGRTSHVIDSPSPAAPDAEDRCKYRYQVRKRWFLIKYIFLGKNM